MDASSKRIALSYAAVPLAKAELLNQAPGLDAYHGFHIHQVGECVAPFTSAGPHWSLDSQARHGKHTGDMPPVLVSGDGTARVVFESHRFNLDQMLDQDGSAIILHNGPDNLANVPIEDVKYADPRDWYNAPKGTAATGDAGDRYACGAVKKE
ncbi:copper/zinc superoxide dismutase (SODC) [Herbihabitans rhizosphaerae]|uniref:Superoxide dismutase [Cu-Zn] n=1 Tax=Herbihabitans rhizosphaerae TaxID=1872711 RepID=A0A4Q7KC85_9PSEU|nr:superoxide dismutase family protein [Herbihabitans rhizosphaerae]RZS29814.1 copper/zinc superoxide dismutase (SODC) [Herbihabitans rhizosphaerae]